MVLVYFLLKANQFFRNGPRSLTRNPLHCPILYKWDFDDLILVGELFAEALRSRETCVLVNNNLCGKLYSSLELPIIFDERFKVTSVPFFILDFSLLIYEWGNFIFKVLHWVILQWCYIQAK